LTPNKGLKLHIPVIARIFTYIGRYVLCLKLLHSLR